MEIEIKIPLETFFSTDSIIPHLYGKLGNPNAVITQIDTYFQSPIRNFWHSDEALRIRLIKSKNSTDKIEITYKGPKQGESMKVREEISIEVSDQENSHVILQHIGFEAVANVKKERINWYYNNHTVVSFDKVENLGFYLEIEISSSDNVDEITKSKEKITQIAKDIIPKWDESIQERRSYLELLILKQVNE